MRQRKVWSKKRLKIRLTQISTILFDLSSLSFSICTFYMSVRNEQRATQLLFWGFFANERNNEKTKGHFWTEFTDSTGWVQRYAIRHFLRNKQEREKKILYRNDQLASLFKVSPFSPSVCLSLSLSLSRSPGTITKPWLERSHDFLPESHSIPSKYSADIVKTSFV